MAFIKRQDTNEDGWKSVWLGRLGVSQPKPYIHEMCSVMIGCLQESTVHKLFEWAEKANEPLRSYSIGILAFIMEGQEHASTFKDKNHKLVSCKFITNWTLLVIHALEDLSDSCSMGLISHFGKWQMLCKLRVTCTYLFSHNIQRIILSVSCVLCGI